jgi:hypothetical protein
MRPLPPLSHTTSSRALAFPILCMPFTPAQGHARVGTRAEPPGRHRDAAPPAAARPPRPGLRAAQRVGAGGWNLRELRAARSPRRAILGVGIWRGLRAACGSQKRWGGNVPKAMVHTHTHSMHARMHACTHARTRTQHVHTLTHTRTFSDLPRPWRAVGSSGCSRRRR